MNNYSGHTVQIWKPSSIGKRPEYVTVGSRRGGFHTKRMLEFLGVGTKRKNHPAYANFTVSRTETSPGWYNVRRVGLTHKECIKLAREFSRAGFDSRVVFIKNYRVEVLETFQKKT